MGTEATDTVANLLLWAGAVGAVGFLVVMLVEGLVRRDYSAVRHPVSALALGERGWIQITNFAVAGAAVTAGAVGALLKDDAVSTVGQVVLGVGILLFGLALLASAIPMDPSRGYPPGAPEGDPERPSWRHHVHDFAGAVVFFSLPVIAVVAVGTLPEWWMKLNAGAMAMLLGVTLVAWSRAWEADAPRAGLLQRAFIVPGWLWLASVFLPMAVQ